MFNCKISRAMSLCTHPTPLRILRNRDNLPVHAETLMTNVEHPSVGIATSNIHWSLKGMHILFLLESWSRVGAQQVSVASIRSIRLSHERGGTR